MSLLRTYFLLTYHMVHWSLHFYPEKITPEPLGDFLSSDRKKKDTLFLD